MDQSGAARDGEGVSKRMKVRSTTTVAMRKAEVWLRDRGGSGLIDRYGRLVAAGEVATFDASTWLRLVAAGKLAGNEGRIRLRMGPGVSRCNRQRHAIDGLPDAPR